MTNRCFPGLQLSAGLSFHRDHHHHHPSRLLPPTTRTPHAAERNIHHHGQRQRPRRTKRGHVRRHEWLDYAFSRTLQRHAGVDAEHGISERLVGAEPTGMVGCSGWTGTRGETTGALMDRRAIITRGNERNVTIRYAMIRRDAIRHDRTERRRETVTEHQLISCAG